MRSTTLCSYSRLGWAPLGVLLTPLLFACGDLPDEGTAGWAGAALQAPTEVPTSPGQGASSASTSPTGTGTGCSRSFPLNQAQLEARCDDPEIEEVSTPPQAGGFCRVELFLIETTFLTGQGISEGRGEISVQAEATDPNTGGGHQRRHRRVRIRRG